MLIKHSRLHPSPPTLSLSVPLHPLGFVCKAQKKKDLIAKSALIMWLLGSISHLASNSIIQRASQPKVPEHRATAACGLVALVTRTEHCFLAFSPDCLPFLLWPEAWQDLQKACSEFVLVLLSLSLSLLCRQVLIIFCANLNN